MNTITPGSMPANPAVGGTSPASTVTTGSASNLGKDEFLKLMVAQLRYQDPMNPADSQSFLAQTAQFTSVEKLEQIASDISAMSRHDKLSTIGTMVGTTVEYADSAGVLLRAPVLAGRTAEDGIRLTLPDRTISLDDVVAIVDPSAT